MFNLISKFKLSSRKLEITFFVLVLILLSCVIAGAGVTKSQVSQLYVSVFNRASEGQGNTFWQSQQDIAAAANAMLVTDAARDYFGANLNTNQAFIEHIYLNTLNKTTAEDPSGIDYWVGELNKGQSRGQVVAALVGVIKEYAPGGSYHDPTNVATVGAYSQFTNRVEVSDYMADTIQPPPLDWETATSFSSGLIVTDAVATITTAKNLINGMADNPPVYGKIPDTGQTTSYTNTFGEDSDYTIHPPSYTKLDANGNDLTDSATAWAMIRDNVTGLIWENKQVSNGVMEYNNPNDADNVYTWYDPNSATNGGNAGTSKNGTDTRDFIDDMNAANYGGHADWRLPTVKELQSIVDYDSHNPSVNGAYFPHFPDPSTTPPNYWSVTTNIGYPDAAAYVSFTNGTMAFAYKSYRSCVRAVRGEQSGAFDDTIISGRMADNGDGAVTDSKTGLMWQQQDDGTTRDLESSITYCEDLTLAGFSDWRLPNVKELFSIVTLSKQDPSTDPVFTNTVSSYYASSTTSANESNKSWSVFFYDGNVGIYYSGNPRLVRAVRGGQ